MQYLLQAGCPSYCLEGSVDRVKKASTFAHRITQGTGKLHEMFCTNIVTDVKVERDNSSKNCCFRLSFYWPISVL